MRAAVQEGRRRTARDLLPARLQPPDHAIGQLAQRFGASWWSLLMFPGLAGAHPVAWGRAAMAGHGGPSPVASYVARHRRPLLLGPEAAPEIRELLSRRDVGNAMAVPVPVGGGTAVLTLSLAAADVRRFTEEDLDLLTRLLAA
jgi:hypothetical protein